MKKIAPIFLLSALLFLIGVNIYKYYVVNTENRRGLDGIVDMGSATTLDDCYYIIFDKNDNANRIGYFISGNMIGIKSQHYSLINIILNRQNEARWGAKEYTYVDIATHETVATINYDAMIGKQNLYGYCDPLIYFYDENDEMNVLCSYYYQRNFWGKSQELEGGLIYNFVSKKKNTEEWDWEDYSWMREYVDNIRVAEFMKLSGHLILVNTSYLQANGLDDKVLYIGNEEGYRGLQVAISLEKLPNDNRRLYSEFPQLKKYKGEQSDGFVILEFSMDLKPDEIVEMLIDENDTVSYEGVLVSAECSIDGEDHYVADYEQYMYYFDLEKQEAKQEVWMCYYSEEYKAL